MLPYQLSVCIIRTQQTSGESFLEDSCTLLASTLKTTGLNAKAKIHSSLWINLLHSYTAMIAALI